ncbi:WbqC family protein [Nibrella saemangeumensis]|uniref:WbqC family protein n=1 Tax=Nibrella saemangeumensis TaxID=1084526 RepID=A0ABP8NTX6_9BACT
MLIELHYLPSLDYMAGLLRFDRVRIEAKEHYQKQSYRNRCYVLTSNKVDCLTVPVQDGTHKQPIRDVRIDNRQAWQDRHWRCLSAAYGKAPFFEYYAPYLEPVIRKQADFLFDLNLELLTICLHLLGQRVDLSLTDWYEKELFGKVFDARSRLNARQRESDYLFYQSWPYTQNFGNVFVPNLSIIDLLFCQGPTALDVLKKSQIRVVS